MTHENSPQGTHVHDMPRTHGGTVELPLEALLDHDPELRLVWAPLTDYPDGSCQYGACKSDEECFCQDEEGKT